MLNTLYEVELQRVVFCPLMMNGPVQFLSGNKRSLHYLQSQAPPITYIHQTPAGVSATAVSDALAKAGLLKQQPTQTSGGDQPAPTPAPLLAAGFMGQFCQPMTMTLVLTYLMTLMSKQIQFYIHIC